MHPILQVMFEATPWGKLNLLEGRLIEAHTTIQKLEVDQRDLMIKWVRLRADAIQARAESVQTFTDMLAIKDKYEMLVEDLKKVTSTRMTLIDEHLRLMAKAHDEIERVQTARQKEVVEFMRVKDQRGAEIQELKEEVSTYRAKADTYDHVCLTLGINHNILGYVRQLKAAHDNYRDRIKEQLTERKQTKKRTPKPVKKHKSK